MTQQETILRKLATKWADTYRRKHLNPKDTGTIRSSQRTAFEFILERAFTWAGGEQAGYGQNAMEALSMAYGSTDRNQKLLSRQDAGMTIWNNFQSVCKKQDKKPYTNRTRSIIMGLTHLARTSPQENLALKFDELIKKGKLAEAFLHFYRIKGIGDKIAAFLLRDLVVALNLEDKIPKHDLQFLQPVDIWVRETATYLWPTLKDAPDWLIAQYITEKCIEHEVSSIRFNQGAWRFGQGQVKETRLLPAALDKLAQ